MSSVSLTCDKTRMTKFSNEAMGLGTRFPYVRSTKAGPSWSRHTVTASWHRPMTTHTSVRRYPGDSGGGSTRTRLVRTCWSIPGHL